MTYEQILEKVNEGRQKAGLSIEDLVIKTGHSTNKVRTCLNGEKKREKVLIDISMQVLNKQVEMITTFKVGK